MTKSLFLAVLAVFALAGCGRSDEAPKPASAPTQASAPAAAAESPSAASGANAPALSEAEQDKAIDLARTAVQQYKLTSLPLDCLSFLAAREDATHDSVEVLENHTPACGGDPNTAPRVVTLLIDKRTGALQKDDPATGEYVPLK
jgi:hypothetical protein